MKKRILSLVLICVMLLGTVPVFALSALAVDVPYTSAWVDYEPVVSDANKTVTYPNSNIWAVGYKEKANADSFVIFDEWASAGGLIRATGTGEWDKGGFFANGTQGVDNVAIATYFPLSYRYIAEYTGTATLKVNELWYGSQSGNGSFAFNSDPSSHAFAIAVNGEVVWPENATYTDTSTWYYNSKIAANIAASIEDVTVEVTAGDAIEFLFVRTASGTTAWSHGWFKPVVEYTRIGAPVTVMHTSAWMDYNPTIVDNAVSYPNSDIWAIGYRKNVNADGFVIFDEWVSASGLIRATGTNEWGQGGFFINGTQGVDNVAIATYYPLSYRYIAEYTGTATLKVNELWYGSQSDNGNFAFNSDPSSHAFAIAVNGEVVWPENATYTDTSTWYYNSKIAANIAASIEDVTVEVTAGDAVEFLFVRTASGTTAWSHGWFKPTVEYTYIDPSSVTYIKEYTVALNEKFAASFYLDGVPEDATDVGATVNGVWKAIDADGKVTLDGIDAKKLADEITVTVGYTYGGKSVTGKTLTTTGAALFMNYVKDDATDTTSNLAIAALNYAAAAQLYFFYNPKNLANAALTESQKTVNFTGIYEKDVTVSGDANGVAKIHSANLILRDEVALKFVFKNCAENFAENYELAVFKDGEVAARFAPTLCEGQSTTYKFILEGIMPSEWNTDYTVAIVEKGGSTPVAETVTYGVMTYLSRMQNNDAIASVCAAMLALYEATVAYGA